MKWINLFWAIVWALTLGLCVAGIFFRWAAISAAVVALVNLIAFVREYFRTKNL